MVNRAELRGYLKRFFLMPWRRVGRSQAEEARQAEVYEVKRGNLAPSAFEIMERCIP